MSLLSLMGKEFIFSENSPKFKILDSDYADAIYKQAAAVALRRGHDAAVEMLEKFVELLPGKMRKLNDLDAIQFSIKQKTEDQVKMLGKKHTCAACNRKFYDMNKDINCPICTTSPRKVVQSKELMKIEST